MKENPLIEHLINITFNKESLFDNDEKLKTYEPFMINKFVSMTEVYTLVVNQINRYDVPKSVHNEYYCSVLPKRKQFFKLIKKSSDNPEALNRICKYYEIGKKEAIHYMSILTNDQVQEICKKYDNK